MKVHYTSVDDARKAVDQLLRVWELADALQRGRREIRFVFQKAQVIDRDPPPGSQVCSFHTAGTIQASGRFSLRVARAEYPAFPQHFTTSPDVETLWYRYEGYVQGREPLPSMAYFCQSFIEKVLARGRDDAATEYHIQRKVLEILGNLHSHKGDLTTRRKMEHEQERDAPQVTQQEVTWMEAALKMLIWRVGEYAANPTVPWPQLSMHDLPQV